MVYCFSLSTALFLDWGPEGIFRLKREGFSKKEREKPFSGVLSKDTYMCCPR